MALADAFESHYQSLNDPTDNRVDRCQTQLSEDHASPRVNSNANSEVPYFNLRSTLYGFFGNLAKGPSIRAYRAILSEFPGGGVLGRRSGVVHRRPFSIFRSPFSVLHSPFSVLPLLASASALRILVPLVSLIASLRHWTPPRLDPRRQKASGTVPSFSDKHQPSRCPVAPSSVVSGPTATVKTCSQPSSGAHSFPFGSLIHVDQVERCK